jgi:hypothetical protein
MAAMAALQQAVLSQQQCAATVAAGLGTAAVTWRHMASQQPAAASPLLQGS